MAHRDLGKEEYWRRVIERWQRSGLSVAAYCRREDLAACSLHWWRQELKRRDSENPAFLPVQVADALSASVKNEIEIVLTSGRRIAVRPGFDAPTLRQVLGVLEEPAC